MKILFSLCAFLVIHQASAFDVGVGDSFGVRKLHKANLRDKSAKIACEEDFKPLETLANSYGKEQSPLQIGFYGSGAVGSFRSRVSFEGEQKAGQVFSGKLFDVSATMKKMTDQLASNCVDTSMGQFIQPLQGVQKIWEENCSQLSSELQQIDCRNMYQDYSSHLVTYWQGLKSMEVRFDMNLDKDQNLDLSDCGTGISTSGREVVKDVSSKKSETDGNSKSQSARNR